MKICSLVLCPANLPLQVAFARIVRPVAVQSLNCLFSRLLLVVLVAQGLVGAALSH